MDEYIQRSYIRKMAMFEMAYTMETETDAAVVLRMIDDAPTADVAPVVHGRWIDDGSGIIICPECERGYNLHAKYTHYRPNCGAKMDGGADYEDD